MQEHSIIIPNATHQKFCEHVARKFDNEIGFYSRDTIARFIAAGEHGTARLALENGEPCGMLLVRPALGAMPLIRSITATAVCMDAQRREHGLALVASVVRDAIDCGQLMVQCWCRQDLEANSFWQAAGFTRCAQRTGETARKHSHTLWRLWLSDAPPDSRLFTIYEDVLKRGPGGKYVSEAHGIKPWRYDLLKPWLITQSRKATQLRKSPNVERFTLKNSFSQVNQAKL